MPLNRCPHGALNSVLSLSNSSTPIILQGWHDTILCPRGAEEKNIRTAGKCQVAALFVNRPGEVIRSPLISLLCCCIPTGALDTYKATEPRASPSMPLDHFSLTRLSTAPRTWVRQTHLSERCRVWKRETVGVWPDSLGVPKSALKIMSEIYVHHV